jgi:hypothetical protein
MINDFRGLLRVVRTVGVDVSQQEKKWSNELFQGVDVEERDLIIGDSDAFYDVSKTGEIRRVIVYITQRAGPKGRYLRTKEELYENFHKYHLFFCQTLKTYKLNRYRKTTRTDGKFRYHLIWDNEEVDPEDALSGRKLELCKNCYKKFPSEFGFTGDVHNFDLEKFTKSGVTIEGLSSSTYLHAVGDCLRLYPNDWAKISKRVKERQNWACQDCQRSLKDQNFRKYLQAHHSDGDPSHNSLANLKVLCIRCHAEQPMHSHIKSDPTYQEFCNLLG